MIAKFALILCLIPLMSQDSWAQWTHEGIEPLTSRKADVVKALGNTSRAKGSAVYIYDYRDREVKITFYNGGCPAAVEKDLNMTRQTVLEVKLTPKRLLKTAANFVPDKPGYEVFHGHGGDKLYYWPLAGTVITTRSQNSIDIVRDSFRIPRRDSIRECHLESFDRDSAMAELYYFGVITWSKPEFRFPPLQVGRYFDEDSEGTKNETIGDLVKELSVRENGVGLIIINGSKNDSVETVAKRTAQLVGVLVKKGIECSKLIIENRSRGGLSGAGFTVVHYSFLEGLKNTTNGCSFTHPRRRVVRKTASSSE